MSVAKVVLSSGFSRRYTGGKREFDIEATLMRTQSAATKLLDHVDCWQKIYSDDVATIHLRKPGAVHTAEPAVDVRAK